MNLMSSAFRGGLELLERCLHSFGTFLAVMNSIPGESTLHGLLLKPLRKIAKADPQSDLRFELQLHDCILPGDPTLSFEGIRRILERRREDQLRKEQLDAMSKATVLPLQLR